MGDKGEKGSGPSTAVKTTIVGGQPPGNVRGVGPGIPLGVEELLSMAAVEPEFARALRERPEETIAASGVALTASGRAILSSVGPENLQAMIRGLKGVLPDEERREFLGRSAAALLLLAGGAAVGAGAAGCDIWGTKVTGSRPEPVQHKYPAPTGVRPDPPEPPPEPRPKPDQGVPRPSPTRGSRPDRPRGTGEPKDPFKK